MLDISLKEKFPFAYNYFSSLLKLVKKGERKFPQALIFEGADTKNQYLFALELARILNCQNDGENDCDCLNCQWIKTYTHPNVNIVSQIHFKPEGDETKTVISTKQAREIENTLSLSSDSHRFFIFFSSREENEASLDLENFDKLGYKTEIDYTIEPLNYHSFHPTTPNALLKSIEEPPEGTTFVFLTKSKEDILSTIVSRCLVFKLSGDRKDVQKIGLNDIFQKYHNLNIENIFDFSDEILNGLKEKQMPIDEFLNQFMNYLKELIKQNLQDDSSYLKIKNDIKIINEAIKHSNANMSDKIVLETLVLRLLRGY